nr:MAG TPA: hypothetical protein [Caudoviricetes sp.]DAN51514.1 MAG TPA: hypothetical protein [Caudoviricetes sp.]
MTDRKLFQKTKRRVRSFNTWRTTLPVQMKKKNTSQKWVHFLALISST